MPIMLAPEADEDEWLRSGNTGSVRWLGARIDVLTWPPDPCGAWCEIDAVSRSPEIGLVRDLLVNKSTAPAGGMLTKVSLTGLEDDANSGSPFWGMLELVGRHGKSHIESSDRQAVSDNAVSGPVSESSSVSQHWLSSV